MQVTDGDAGGGHSIRTATASDAAAVAELAERTFRETFAPDNSAADMNAYCKTAFGVEVQRAEIALPGSHFLLVEEGGAMVAYAHLRDDKKPPPSVTGAAPILLSRFYVDAPRHGTGLAQTLMGAVFVAARRRGARTLYLTVWDRNPRARKFYQKLGFVEVGTEPFVLGTDHQIDIIVAREL